MTVIANLTDFFYCVHWCHKLGDKGKWEIIGIIVGRRNKNWGKIKRKMHGKGIWQRKNYQVPRRIEAEKQNGQKVSQTTREKVIVNNSIN